MDVKISQTQRRLHIAGEILALLSLPFLFQTAANTTGSTSTGLYTMAAGTAIIDGTLLWMWYRV